MKKTDAKIAFHFLDVKFPFKNRNALKGFLKELFHRENRPLNTLTYIFCTDEYLLQMNKDFLSHDYYTDIITFELAEKNGPTEGEIYISIDRVKDNAHQHKSSFESELHRVIFHGALHLCGFKDKNKAQERMMRTKEDEYLELYFG